VHPQEVPEADEEDVEELPECPDHRPSFFERGKPQIISPSICKYLINAFTLINTLRSGVVSIVAALYLVYLCILYPCYPDIRSRVNA
jgi:hypothetical protein